MINKALLIILLICLLSSASPFKSGHIVTSEFGSMKGFGGTRRPDGHTGVDLIPEAWPFTIYPIAEGVVLDIGIDAVYGKFIIIEHSKTLRSFYAHGATIYNTALPGKPVTINTPIMRMGATGYSDGPHLHLEVRILENGEWGPVDPMPYIE